MQGRLDPLAQAEVEQHVESCDDCCRLLRDVPDDTLAASLRVAGGAETMCLDDSNPSTAPATNRQPQIGTPAKGDIPRELLNHPRYRVVRQLGQGGMGVVYLAEHRLMDRMVALKVINQRLLSSPTALERFMLEVKAAARLSHSAIVTAHDAEQAGELHYLVTEYVDGVSLHEHVARKGPLPGPLACSLIRQAAQGLQHASDKGMVHRDIKPQNLMVTRKGQVKILDFGLARLAHQQAETLPGEEAPAADDGDRGLTLDGVVLGTPDYIAPEQVSNSRTVDSRADIYSLGCTFYFLLTGKTPFTGGSAIEKAMAHLRSSPRPLEQFRPDLPAEVKAIVERMMAKNPADRFQTPGEVAQALTPFIKAAKSAAEAGSLAASSSLSPHNHLATQENAGLEPAAQPLEDLLAAYPLPGQTQPGYGFSQPFAGGNPLGLQASPRGDWQRSLRRHRRVLAFGGGGAAFLLAVVCAWSMWGGGGGKSPNGQVAMNSPVGQQASDRDTWPAEAQVRRNGMAGTAAATDAPDVLLVIPHNGFWWADYEPIHRVLDDAGIKVVIGSSVTGLAYPYKDEPGATQVLAEVDLEHADPQAYDAVVFIGGNVEEFINPATGLPAAKRLMERMLEEGRWVTGMCVGTAVLYKADILRDRDAVANTNIPRQLLEESNGVRWSWEPHEHVIVSGKVVTGGSYEHAEEFAHKLVELLNKQ